ncbi:SDR family oxidoreductase [bacterium]|nr:SDR family oxidoreductase [bacterium]
MKKPLLCPTSLLSTDLSGKTYLVTGGNSGIGLATIEQLAKQGARVILACRRSDEGKKAIAQLQKKNLSGSVEFMKLDLADLESIRQFSGAFLKTHSKLDGLINNAGVMNTPLTRTKNGFELQIGVNHLGHYLLTELLLPVLTASAPSRIVNLSSCYHDRAMGREGVINFDDLNFNQRKYDGWTSYAQSKLANLLHAKHLAKRLSGTGVLSVSVHPGWVRTNLFRSTMPQWFQNIFRPLFRMSGMLEPWEGAQSTLYALLAPEVLNHNGAFFSQTGFYRERKATKGGWPLISPNPHAHDDEMARRLDEVSRQLVGLT